MRVVVSALFALSAVATSLSADAADIKCEGEYPYHPQGVATDGTNIYWSFTTVLVKTDLTGKFIAKAADLGSHVGDICCHGGRVYAGINNGKRRGVRVGDEVWEFDAADLSIVRKYPTPEAIWCNNGVEWYGDSFWVISSAPHHFDYNLVFRYSRDFKYIGCRVIASGWTNLGVQTILLFGDKMLFGCYGSDSDPEKPHPSCVLEVEAAALSAPVTKGRDYPPKPGERPAIVPCAKRHKLSAASGMLVLGGKFMTVYAVRLSPPAEKKKQRWTAILLERPLP